MDASLLAHSLARETPLSAPFPLMRARIPCFFHTPFPPFYSIEAVYKNALLPFTLPSQASACGRWRYGTDRMRDRGGWHACVAVWCPVCLRPQELRLSPKDTTISLVPTAAWPAQLLLLNTRVVEFTAPPCLARGSPPGPVRTACQPSCPVQTLHGACQVHSAVLGRALS